MKRNLVCACVLLIAALGATVAKADSLDATTYTILFSGSPTFPTAGSFTYDPDTYTFSNFVVTWSGINFDLTSSANAPSVSATAPPCIGGATGGAASFAFLSGACAPAQGNFTTDWFGHLQPSSLFEFSTDDGTSYIKVLGTGNLVFVNDLGGGDWTLTQTSGPTPGTAPEPGTLAMFGSGLLGIAGVIRRKIK